MDSVLVSDHFVPWRHKGGHAPFSLAWMAAAGEHTMRVMLGTSVLTPTFRHNPAVIAQAFATPMSSRSSKSPGAGSSRQSLRTS